MRVFPTVLLLVAFSAETASAFDKGARPFGVGVAPVIDTPFHDFDFGIEADFSLAVRYYY
jgi:hypothetical protein